MGNSLSKHQLANPLKNITVHVGTRQAGKTTKLFEHYLESLFQYCKTGKVNHTLFFTSNQQLIKAAKDNLKDYIAKHFTNQIAQYIDSERPHVDTLRLVLKRYGNIQSKLDNGTLPFLEFDVLKTTIKVTPNDPHARYISTSSKVESWYGSLPKEGKLHTTVMIDKDVYRFTTNSSNENFLPWKEVKDSEEDEIKTLIAYTTVPITRWVVTFLSSDNPSEESKLLHYRTSISNKK